MVQHDKNGCKTGNKSIIKKTPKTQKPKPNQKKTEKEILLCV